ncbi:non-ribosomal peptide synthetase [Clostridium beijerinckii]|uniref:Pyochelin synthetase n=1 Tax=Clostridium beijerinckii TaxID=1520 RepID=A0AAE5LN90_CLOBE|nr:non-ribosomal peptide synthetase [Clostridium beijerinckii]NSB12323.1 pyochelin synthetase [Clostridium beijerinckii]OOM30793.1 phenyloxazoline synthase MbtB [Clostridium beijerinckii]
MSITELIDKHESLGIKLWVDNGKLRFRAPAGVMNSESKAELMDHKNELIKYLSDKSDSHLTCDIENKYTAFPLTDVQTAYLVGRNNVYEYGGVGCHAYIELTMPVMDSERLERAWHAVINRHEMLRAVVFSEGYQKVLEEVNLPPLKEQNLRGLNKKETEAAIKKVRDKLSTKQYKTDEWPLFDLFLTTLEESSILHLSIDMLISDFVSANILLKELDHFYYEPEKELEPISISYRDILLFEQSRKNHPSEKAKKEKDKQYWMERLEEMPESPELPVNVEKINTEKVIFDQYKLSLSKEKWEKICRQAKLNRITPSVVVLAAYAEVIGLWSKKSDFCINLTLLNRQDIHEDINKVIGDFTVVDVFQVEGGRGDTFVERAKMKQKRLWRDLEHSGFSGVEVLREMHRQRNKNVIMPVVYTSTIGVGDSNAIDGDFMRNSTVTYKISQTPQVWIDCQVTEEKGMLCVNWDVRKGVFKEGIIEDAFESFSKLINKLADDEEAWNCETLAQLPSHVKEIREKVNDTLASIPEGLLHDKFCSNVKNQPDNIALICKEGEFTYRNLAEHAAAVQKALIEEGCQKGDIVGIILEKGIWQTAAVLGVLLAGCTYVPIDASQPVSRQNSILEDSGIKYVLTNNKASKEEYKLHISLIKVENLQPFKISDIETVKRESADAAYIIYTSGSTGKPKGVVISHRAALNTIADINSKFQVSSRDRILGLANLAFDLSVYDIFGILSAGGTLVLPDPDHVKEPNHWADMIVKYKITLWNSVPAQMEMLVSCLKSRKSTEKVELRLALLSGDWIPTTLPKEMQNQFPKIKIISLGGATEAAIWSIYYPIDSNAEYEKSIPYGIPLTNQKFYVLNEKLQPCPDWTAGNLYIGGEGLALEYLGNKKLTEERFIIHPETKERLYYTGDIGRYRPDGIIEFLGREDTQVKIHGHRIELSEIESVLQKHPSVSAAVTIVSGNNPSEYKLASFVQPKKLSCKKLNEQDDNMHNICFEAWEKVSQSIDRDLFAKWMENANKTTLSDIMRTLFNAGLFKNEGCTHTLEEIQSALKVSVQYHQLIRRWLRALCAEKYLLYDESKVEYSLLNTSIKNSDFEECWREWYKVEEKIKYGDKLMDYFKESSINLPKLLTGEADPLELLFPKGSSDIAMSAYRDNLINKCMNHVVKEAVLFMVDKYSKINRNKTIRILEVGAGVGGTTSEIIPVLNNYNAEYHFTDISTFFLNKAREAYGDYPWISYGLFDLNKEYWKQGLTASSWDIIICANVLHDAYDVPSALAALKELAVPNGKIIVIDAIHEAYSLLTSLEFKGGLTGFTDSRKEKAQVFFEREEWISMFSEAGLKIISSYPEKYDKLNLGGQGVFITRFEAENESVSAEELKEFARDNLPQYMVPGHIEVIPKLPLTNNGKVNRNILKERIKNIETFISVTGEEAENDLEARIARIWADVLKRDKVWRNDNFYEIGGDSLLIAQVVAKMRETLDEAMELEWDRLMLEIIRNPTVAQISKALMDNKSELDKNMEGYKSDNKPPYVVFAEAKDSSKGMKVIMADATGLLTPYNYILPYLINDEKRNEAIVGFSYESTDLYEMESCKDYILNLSQEYARILLKSGASEFEVIGYCMGGLVALETARVLLESGAHVKRVITIDTGVNQPDLESELLMERAFGTGLGADMYKAGHTIENDVLKKALESLKKSNNNILSTEALCSLDGEFKQVGDCYRKLADKSQEERLLNIFSTVSLLNGESMNYSIDKIKTMYKVFFCNFKAVREYKSYPFMGDVLALRCSEKGTAFLPIEDLKCESFWEEITLGDLEIKYIKGNHMTCIKPPNSDYLGKLLIGGIE